MSIEGRPEDELDVDNRSINDVPSTEEELEGQTGGTEQEEGSTPAQEGQQPTRSGGEEPLAHLDPVLRQTARRADLSEEQVARLGDDAEDFLRTLKKQQDDLSARYGRLGKQALGQVQGGQQGNVPPPQGQEGGNFPGAGTQPQPVQGPMGNLPAPQQQPAGSQTQPTQQPRSGNEQGQPEENFEPLELPDMDDLRAIGGDELADTMQGMVDRLNAGMRQLQQIGPAVQKFSQHQQRRQQQEAVQLGDRFIKSLNADYEGYKGFYGEGPMSRLDPNSQEYENRQRLINEAGAIRIGALRQGEQMSPRRALQLANSVLADEIVQGAADEETASQAEKEGRQAIQEPTTRQPAPDETGVEAAKQAASEAAKEKGIW